VITASEELPLAAGMTISVHPNFCSADERFGASAVDTYLVTETGAERLSAIPEGIQRPEEAPE
jgi:Xaa-Pro aminopeptidase